MSYWPIVFIVLAIAMAVGPIMIMQPSRRDRRLAELRQKAASLGLQLRLSDYEGSSVAVYTLPVILPKNTPTWQIIKQAYAHGLHFYQHWQLSSSSTIEMVPATIADALKAYIDQLPDDIVGIEVSNKIVGIWWQEKPNSVTIDEVKSLLEKLRDTVA